MIDKVSDAAALTATAEASPKPAAQKTLQHTPFGDVLVDELATTDVFALMAGNKGDARSESPKAPESASTPAATSAATATQGTEPPLTILDASAMTANALFGPHPWLDNPTGAGAGASWNYNPVYFATRQTADKIAALLGGKVVEQNALTPFGPLQQQVANEMIELPNGKIANAGLIANYFAHGYSQSFVYHLLQLETQGA